MNSGKKMIYALCMTALLGSGVMMSGCSTDPNAGNPLINVEEAASLPMMMTENCLRFDVNSFGGHRRNISSNMYGRVFNGIHYFTNSGESVVIEAMNQRLEIRDEEGNVLYRTEELPKQMGFSCSIMNTSRGNIRLWLISTIYGNIWVLKEENGHFTQILNNDDLEKDGFTRPTDQAEHLTADFFDHALNVALLRNKPGEKGPRVDKYIPEKSLYYTWDGKGWKSSDKKPEAKAWEPSLAARIFGPKRDVSIEKPEEGKVVSLNARTEDNRESWDEECSKIFILTDGRKIRFNGYTSFFQLTGDQGEIFYTSSPVGIGNQRFDITPLKTDNADINLWMVKCIENNENWGVFGCWLIGEEKGRVKVYLTDEEFKKARIYLNPYIVYSVMDPLELSTIIEDGGITVSSHHYARPAIPSSLKPEDLSDKTARIVWDKKQQRFILTDVKEV